MSRDISGMQILRFEILSQEKKSSFVARQKYKIFVERKFEIQFVDKNKIDIARNEELCEREKYLFYEDHIKYSSMILFKENNPSDYNNDKEEKRIKQFGIIVNFENKIPLFLHQSYAEYFLARHARNMINETRVDKDKIINQILIESEFFLVRKFLNDFLSLYEFKMDVEQKKNLHKQKQIENCCRENLFNILNYLIIMENADIKSKNHFLLKASNFGHKKIVELLIEKGIDINQTNINGTNALHIAANNGHNELVKLLIEKGIDINKTDKDGQNALHIASQKGHKEIVELLLQKEINLNQTDKYGQNALHLAYSGGHKDIV